MKDLFGGGKPLSFIKLKIETEDINITTIHIKNIIRKIDMVYIVDQNIFIILPLTDQIGVEMVYTKINDRVLECKVNILEKDLFTFSPESQQSSDELIKILGFL